MSKNYTRRHSHTKHTGVLWISQTSKWEYRTQEIVFGRVRSLSFPCHRARSPNKLSLNGFNLNSSIQLLFTVCSIIIIFRLASVLCGHSTSQCCFLWLFKTRNILAFGSFFHLATIILKFALKCVQLCLWVLFSSRPPQNSTLHYVRVRSLYKARRIV